MKRFFLFLSFSLILVLFSACTVLAVDGELNLEADEKWSMSVTATLPGDEAAFLSLMDEKELMSMLNEYGTDVDDMPAGVTYDVKVLDADENGDIPLMMSFSGEGYDTLNSLGEQVISTKTVDGKEITYFHMEGMGSDDMGMGAQSTSFTLNANGKITESNGEIIDNNSAIWYDFNGDMTATIEPGGANILDSLGIDLDIDDTQMMIIAGVSCCLCLVVIIIIVVVIILVRRNKKKNGDESSPSQYSPPPVTPAATDETRQV